MLTLGISRSTTVLLSEVKASFNISEKASASYIAGPMIMGGLAAPLAAWLCTIYAVRKICIFGALSGFTLLFSSVYFDLSFLPFILLTSVAGFFHGSVLVSAPVEVNKWFEPEQRPVANALVWTGSSLGALWVGPAITYVGYLSGSGNEQSNWKFAVMALSTLQLIGIVLASCFLKTADDDSLLEKNKFQKSSLLYLLQRFPRYKLYLLSQFGYTFWRSAYYVYLVDFAMTSMKFSRQKASLLLTIDAACEIFFRPIAGKLASRQSRYLCLFLIYTCQAVTSILPAKLQEFYISSEFTKFSYPVFAGVVAIIGALQGASGGLDMTTIVDTVGVDLARSAYAKSTFMEVFLAGVATQFFGHMNSKNRFYVGSICIGFSAIMSLFGHKMRKTVYEDDHVISKPCSMLLKDNDSVKTKSTNTSGQCPYK